MAQSVWTVPAARMKRRLEHALPLPRQCMDMRQSMLGERCPRPSSSRPRARSPCSCPRTPALCTQGLRLWEDPAQCTASGKPSRRQRAPAASGTATSSRRSLSMRGRGPGCQQSDGLHGIAPGDDAVARRALMLNFTHDLAVVPLHGCMVVAEHCNGLGICILKARSPCGALDAGLLGKEALALAVPKIDSDFGCAGTPRPSRPWGQSSSSSLLLSFSGSERGERPGRTAAPCLSLDTCRRSGGVRSSQHRIADCIPPSSGSVKSVG